MEMKTGLVKIELPKNEAEFLLAFARKARTAALVETLPEGTTLAEALARAQTIDAACERIERALHGDANGGPSSRGRATPAPPAARSKA